MWIKIVLWSLLVWKMIDLIITINNPGATFVIIVVTAVLGGLVARG